MYSTCFICKNPITNISIFNFHSLIERTHKIREWFTTNAIYTSTYDLISKILQFDVDGDKSLVVADPDFVRIAERNMNGVVLLYYNMRKAEPTELNNRKFILVSMPLSQVETLDCIVMTSPKYGIMMFL
jgi:hypothetical protein